MRKTCKRIVYADDAQIKSTQQIQDSILVINRREFLCGDD